MVTSETLVSTNLKWPKIKEKNIYLNTSKWFNNPTEVLFQEVVIKCIQVGLKEKKQKENKNKIRCTITKDKYDTQKHEKCQDRPYNPLTPKI